MLFTENKPVAAGTINELATDTRENLHALRDAVVMGGVAFWNYSISGGTAEQPNELRYTKGAQRIRCKLTWGVSGGAIGSVTVAEWEYTADHAAASPVWLPIATETLTYDSGFNCIATVWS